MAEKQRGFSNQMANRFVRPSKYRHTYGQASKKEACYDNIKVSKSAWDTNLVAVNPLFISVNIECGGGTTKLI